MTTVTNVDDSAGDPVVLDAAELRAVDEHAHQGDAAELRAVDAAELRAVDAAELRAIDAAELRAVAPVEVLPRPTASREADSGAGCQGRGFHSASEPSTLRGH